MLIHILSLQTMPRELFGFAYAFLQQAIKCGVAGRQSASYECFAGSRCTRWLAELPVVVSSHDL